MQRGAEALTLHRSGQLEMARIAYGEAVKRSPRDATLQFNYGQCVLQLGDTPGALDHFQAAVDLEPGRVEYQTGLANAASVAAQYDRALTAGRVALELNVEDAVAQYLVGYALEQLHRLEDAGAHVAEALATLPEDVQLQILGAHLRGRRGEVEEAVSELRGILKCSLLTSRHRQRAAHELGMLLDKSGDYLGAFEAFEMSGRATASSPAAKKYDRQVRLRQIRSYRVSVQEDSFDSGVESVDGEMRWSGPGLAFLVGFPRSGTTLTEQILAAHGDIVTGDELPLVTTIANEARQLLGKSISPAAILKRLTAEHVRGLRDRYWEEARAEVGEIAEGKIFIDKMPLNVIDLPLIRLIFPEAKILMALRDPRDVCLSCFMQDFRLNNSMIHFLTLERSAEFYEQVMDLYLHYRGLGLFDILEVRYEDTVADLEMQGRRILGHLGLEWDAGLLEFHHLAQERMISTPSAAAVREPVHQRAVRRFENYTEPLAAVVGGLMPFVREFGYEE